MLQIKGFHESTGPRAIFKPGCLPWILNIARVSSIFFPAASLFTYLTAPGRCPLEIEKENSKCAPQRTLWAPTWCSHHY